VPEVPGGRPRRPTRILCGGTSTFFAVAPEAPISSRRVFSPSPWAPQRSLSGPFTFAAKTRPRALSLLRKPNFARTRE
jgi:hypothetical protein